MLEAVPAPVAQGDHAAADNPDHRDRCGRRYDGQVLVWHDLLGLYHGPSPRFVKQYADLATTIRDAVSAYADDVREGRFPEDVHTYGMSDEERSAFEAAVTPGRRA